MKRPLLIGALLVTVAGAGFSFFAPGSHINVSPGSDLQTVLDAAQDGDVIELAAGRYAGPIEIHRSVRLIGEGAAVHAPSGARTALVVSADAVTLEALSVTGGETGVSIREVEEVLLKEVGVSGQPMHGIEIVDASASILGAVVEVAGDYAQGIEVRNSDGRPDSRIEDSFVSGGQEGIVSHVSEVIVQRNVVRNTSMRAITITEMSDGVVRNNDISGATGAGLYCGDMSRCEFTGNTVSFVSDNGSGTSGAGWGLLVTYHSSASEAGNVLEGEAGAINTMLGSRLIERSPLEPGRGAAALPYAMTALIAGLGLLLLITKVAGAKVHTWMARRLRPSSAWAEVGAAVLVVTVAVQSFHMGEHFLQLFRVFVDGVPSRGGLVGPAVEPEWVHLLYNLIFLGGIGAVIMSRASGWGPRSAAGDSALGGVFLLQGYHAVEHLVKVGQHLATGAKVNPGLAGEFFNLVLLHFAINAAVYAGLLFACGSYLLQATSRRSTAQSVAG